MPTLRIQTDLGTVEADVTVEELLTILRKLGADGALVRISTPLPDRDDDVMARSRLLSFHRQHVKARESEKNDGREGERHRCATAGIV